MELVAVNYAIIKEGEGWSKAALQIEPWETVALLKDEVKKMNTETITGDADKLQLFLAKTGSEWLSSDVISIGSAEIPARVQELLDGQQIDPLEDIGTLVKGAPTRKTIHVLVVVPDRSRNRARPSQAEMVVEGPGAKRQRIWPTAPALPEELIAIAELGQQLNRETDLAVGTVLKVPSRFCSTRLGHGLYIRQEYWDLYEVIKQQLAADGSIDRILVLGSPGIGKSVFGVFLLLVFMAERKDVSYRPLFHEWSYYFNWNSVNGYEISEIPLRGKKYEGLFDGRESRDAVMYTNYLHAYMFASPRTRNYNEFVKGWCLKVYMNPWTKAECHKLAETISCDQEEWFRRFLLVGGIPRLLFSPVTLYEDLVTYVKCGIPATLAELEKMVSQFEKGVLDKDMQHIAFHIYRDNRSFYLGYASLTVESIVSSRYEIWKAEELRNLLQTPAPNLQSWRGRVIENLLLEDLIASIFCARQLDGTNAGIVKNFGPFNAKSRLIQAPSEIEDKLMLYIPISKNLPAMDGVLVVPSDRLVIYAQSTVSSNHPITPNQLKKVYTDLTSRDPDVFSGYTHILLFIVSADMYDEFRVQRYRNVDGKNRTQNIGINVTQYVGKIIQHHG